MSEPHILIRLQMYFPWNWEFGSALSKLRNFRRHLNPPKTPSQYSTDCRSQEYMDVGDKFGIEKNGDASLRKARAQRGLQCNAWMD
jgi:hypothetical protein